MYNQQESGWADGQLNENNERTDDLDGAAEGDNDTSSRISVQNQTAPSRPRSRDSYYDRDRDIRERGEPEYYSSGRSRNHGNGGGGSGEPRRRRNESYRDRDRSRMDDYEYDYRESRHARPMADRRYQDPYYGGGYGGGGRVGGYGMQPPGWMMNVREMLERLRVEDPRRYREWYDRYTAHKRNPHRVPDPGLPYMGPPVGPHPPMTPLGAYSGYGDMTGGGGGAHSMSMYAGSTGGERQSVHSDAGRPSGRSSVNAEIMTLSMSGIPYANGPSQTPSINQDPDVVGFKSISDHHFHESPEPKRMTPMKYNTSHCLGVLTPLGQLIKVNNEGSTIEIVQVKSLLSHLPEFKEVSAFPGPLVKETTHKNTVIQFCQRKIKEIQSNENQLDKENFILLWELLILLLRKNGNVFGSDVSELLLKKNSVPSSDEASSAEEYQSKESSSDEEDSAANALKPEPANTVPVDEAKASEKFCEFLLYGHKKEALEFAMDNGLWGHALFLATKMDERTYGTVLARFANCTPFNHPLQTFYQLMSGRQPASAKSCCDDSFGDWRPHLAMILSNAGTRPDVEFKAIVKMGDTLGSKNHVFGSQFCYLMGQMDFSQHSKLGPLLGLKPSVDNIIEATQMTEIYEFARSLAEPSFTLGPSFFKSKLNYSKTLLDLGFVEEAFAYCEVMAKKLKFLSAKGCEDEVESVKWSVLQIAERLVKIEDTESEEDPKWIQELRQDLSPGKQSGIENSSDRRASIPESNGNRETLDGIPESAQEHEQKPPDFNTLGEHQNNMNNAAEPVQPPNIDNSNYNNFRPSGPYDIPMYNPPTSNQLSPTNSQPQVQPQIGLEQQGSQHSFNGPQQYQQQQQIPYGTDVSNQNAMVDSSQNQPQYGHQQPLVDSYSAQQYPDYMSNNNNNNNNNNYLTPANGYAMPPMYGQPPMLSDGPLGGPTGANKKKSVRFEDDETLEDSDDNTLLGQTLKQIALSSDEVNDKFSFCHPLKLAVRNNYVGYKEKKNLSEEQKFKLQSERSAVSIGGERRLSSDEIMEEIDRIACSRSLMMSSSTTNSSPSSRGTTYPIDEPVNINPLSPSSCNARPPTLGLKKTFPIDKHCCHESEMCEDHDNFYHGSNSSNSSSVVSSPTSSGPKVYGSNGSLTGGGPNSFVQAKAYESMHSTLPPMSNQKPGAQQGQKDNKSSNQNNKANGSKPSKGGGGGGDGKQSSGWFSGIMSKFSLKAPNQMILPDDKDPAIVWDPTAKKWINTKGDDDEDSGPKGPPPTDSDLMRGQGPPRPPMMQQQPGMMMGQPPMMHNQQQQHQNMLPQGIPPQLNNPSMNPDGMNSGPSVPSSYPQNPQQQPLQPQQQQQQQQQQPLQSQLPSSGLPNPQLNAQNMSAYQNQPSQGQFTGQQQMNAASNPVNTGFNSGPAPTMNGPPSLPTGNKYKLPKNRSIRSGYVDILNPNNTPGGGTLGNGGPGGNVISPAGGAPGVPNMFIPSPIAGSGDSGPVSFLTPAPPGPLPAQSQLEAN